jgi:ribosomal protein S18 acetylase RimI-like enzyme
VNVRRATEADEAVLRELWEEFEAEVPPPPEFVETWEEEWQDVAADIVERGVVLLAEDDEGVVGLLRAGTRTGGVWYVGSAYVRPRARRRGVLRELLREAVREGAARHASRVTLDVLADNEDALAVWRSFRFEPVQLSMAAPLGALEARLAAAGRGATFGSIHVQTDDRERVAAAVEKYRPRIAPPAGTTVAAPASGWTAIYDERLEREPALLQRLAKELSNALGAVVCCFVVEEEAVVAYSLYERGSSVDDYRSVPEFHGPLPPGDVVSLAANPRVVQRLTGADPGAVRAVARNAASPAELPPARELAGQLGELMGISGADRGYS